MNSILLRRKNKVIVVGAEGHLSDVYLATALRKLEQYGYTFSENLLARVRTLSDDTFLTFYKEVVSTIKQLTGAHRSFVPLYPNFPKEVMELDESILYLNAILHYVSPNLIRKAPFSNPIEERFPLIDQLDLRIIDLGTKEEFLWMIQQLISSRTSLSQTDKEDIEWAIANSENVDILLPDEIPIKENMAFTIGTLLKYDKIFIHQINRYFHTATDVLRLAVSLSEGDASLATNTRFKKFNRPERRLLLGLLEKCGNRTEDMLRYKEQWKRLGEILHPGQYKSQFPKTLESFDVLRKNYSFATFAGKVETSLECKDIEATSQFLKARPGEFARRLDHLVRNTFNPERVVQDFSEIADKVATPVLLQVMTHFKYRNEDKELRTIFPKGNVGKAVALKNTLQPIQEDIRILVVEICRNTLIGRFSSLKSLGKVWVDERLKGYLVPFSQRSASKALRTLVRGSNLDLPEGNTIRFFLWWKEGEINGEHTGRVDIDLSSIMYDENWEYKEHISYTNLKSAKYQACHSGDITSAPNGACEFIDLHIPSILQYGGRYIVMSINSFTHQPFCDLPECFAGWMGRKEPNSGEVFEPTCVQDKVDLASDTTISIPVILDLAKRKVVWTDIALRRHPVFYNNIEGNFQGITLMGKAMTTLKKTDLYDLFSLHGLSRGRIVENKEEADTIFSVEEGVTPFDLEKIMSEFMV